MTINTLQAWLIFFFCIFIFKRFHNYFIWLKLFWERWIFFKNAVLPKIFRIFVKLIDNNNSNETYLSFYLHKLMNGRDVIGGRPIYWCPGGNGEWRIFGSNLYLFIHFLFLIWRIKSKIGSWTGNGKWKRKLYSWLS